MAVVKSGSTLPLAFLAHPNADYRFQQSSVSSDSTFNTSVSNLLEFVAEEKPTTGIAAGGFEIKSLASGSVVETAEYQGGQAASAPIWSTDDRLLYYQDEKAQYLHRVGTGTMDMKIPPGFVSSIGFSSDSSGSAVVSCALDGFVSGPVAVGGVLQVTNGGGSCELAQAEANNSDPVAVYSYNGVLYQLTPAGQGTTIDTSSLGSPIARLSQSCNGLVTLSFGVQGVGLYDVQSGMLTNTGARNATCDIPIIPSPNRKAYAVWQQDGVFVIAAGSGAATQVARTGTPIAWSADGGSLLVRANGTFVVKADGSGGADAAAQIDEASKSHYLDCRVADTGSALLMTANGPVLYDIAAGTSAPLPTTDLGPECSVTPDKEWLVSGSLLVHLTDRKGAVLPPYDTREQQATASPASGFLTDDQIGEYRWSGAQEYSASDGRKS